MCNVGGIDRIVRIIAGAFLLSLVFVADQIRCCVFYIQMCDDYLTT